MASTINMAGATKQTPATISPRHPARRNPRWIASSVELGPGIRLVAPTRSRNCESLSHLRRFTTSSCMMARWAAGPPKAVAPSLRKRQATSVSGRTSHAARARLHLAEQLALLGFELRLGDGPLLAQLIQLGDQLRDVAAARSRAPAGPVLVLAHMLLGVEHGGLEADRRPDSTETIDPRLAGG